MNWIGFQVLRHLFSMDKSKSCSKCMFCEKRRGLFTRKITYVCLRRQLVIDKNTARCPHYVINNYDQAHR